MEGAFSGDEENRVFPGRSSGASGSGSISTVSIEENLALSSEDSSYRGDECELELGLGLGPGGAGKVSQGPPRDRQHARILTAMDFSSMVSSNSFSSASSSTSSVSSSSSSSSLSGANAIAGTKRNADSVTATNGSSQVVGWPPIQAYRMNSLVNQVKLPASEVFDSIVDKVESKLTVVRKYKGDCSKNNANYKEKRIESSLFVKVNMDGVPIGRKVNLRIHSSYETLAQTLEDMFHGPTTFLNPLRSGKDEHETRRLPKLLNGLSEFVLTYEDKDGDWMLIGDVPWRMFLSSVRRLRIMRSPEATGLSSSSKAIRKG